MSTEAVSVKDVQEPKPEPAEATGAVDPYEFLNKVPGAPSKSEIESWKNQTPNGRVKVFTPDYKRIYILRGVSALELEAVQASIPQNTSPEKVDGLIQKAVIARACLWASSTNNHKLNEMDLSVGGAGLPVALFEVISQLSDFMGPNQIEKFSADL